MTDPLPDTMPNVSCPVCHAPPGKVCVALDHRPFPQGHRERHETTPAADAAMAAVVDPWRSAVAALHEAQQTLAVATARFDALLAVAVDSD